MRREKRSNESRFNISPRRLQHRDSFAYGSPCSMALPQHQHLGYRSTTPERLSNFVRWPRMGRLARHPRLCQPVACWASSLRSAGQSIPSGGRPTSRRARPQPHRALRYVPLKPGQPRALLVRLFILGITVASQTHVQGALCGVAMLRYLGQSRRPSYGRPTFQRGRPLAYYSISHWLHFFSAFVRAGKRNRPQRESLTTLISLRVP